VVVVGTKLQESRPELAGNTRDKLARQPTAEQGFEYVQPTLDVRISHPAIQHMISLRNDHTDNEASLTVEDE